MSDDKGERIAKLMARAGLCSRREAEAWIAAGRVSVNGKTLTSAALNVHPGDSVVVDGQPLAFPVNFTLDGNAVVLRTDEGTKLHAARRDCVSFECDDVDRRYHTGWSVIITGRAEEVREPAEVARLERLPLGPWCPVAKPVWLRIRPRTISGRRIPAPGTFRPPWSALKNPQGA